MTKARTILALASAGALGLIAYKVLNTDYFRWPESAMLRIEGMAETLSQLRGPARWCYPAESAPGNLAVKTLSPPGLDDCFAKLSPTSDFIEEHPRDYMKRFYGADIDGFVCEVTLSTVWNEDRIVGSDCYYGIFRESEFPAVGVTDEPFG